MPVTSLIFGALVGLSLGLTGGGGAIFAVPLLVYGLGLSAKDAVATSLSAVGAISIVGFISHWHRGNVELRTGLLFAVAGMVGAPIGTWIAGLLSQTLLLLLFAVLMAVVAVRLWQKAGLVQSELRPAVDGQDCMASGPSCERDPSGILIMSSCCAVLLIVVGVITGILSGLFGVGGGFIIVPALVLFSGMSIHRAVGTSLMVIVLISASGVASQILAGRIVSGEITLLFVAGGIAGLFAGQAIGRKLSGTSLQKTFAVAILLVAAFVIVRNIFG